MSKKGKVGAKHARKVGNFEKLTFKKKPGRKG